jgi:hypothetical protein
MAPIDVEAVSAGPSLAKTTVFYATARQQRQAPVANEAPSLYGGVIFSDRSCRTRSFPTFPTFVTRRGEAK